MKIQFLCIAVFTISLTSQCSGIVARPELIHHVIAANSDGLAVHPKTEEQFEPAQFAAFVNDILNAAEQLAERRQQKVNGRLRVKVLVHVHGGLNGTEATEKRVETFADTIMNEKEDWYYPIFVRWPSGALSTYTEQVMHIRRGNRSPWWGPISAPFVFMSDLVQSLGQMPANCYYQSMNMKERTVTFWGWNRALSKNWKDAIAASNHVNVRTSHAFSDPLITSRNVCADVVATPVRLTLGALCQGTIAQSAWGNMKRRTTHIVHPAPLIGNPADPDAIKEKGAGHFFDLLNKRAEQSNSGETYSYEVYFIGHSMGAIVLNNIFTKYNRDWMRSKSIRGITYMAAAASVNETADAVIPLLLGYAANNVPFTFHNLTLNRVAEISERMAYGVAPAGSLLEQVDQHVGGPNAMPDRTMGSEINVLNAIHLFDEVKAYCEFKAFDFKPGYRPATHSDFNKLPFWKPSFWSQDTVTTPNGRNYYGKRWLREYKPAQELRNPPKAR